ncbi:MAG: DUF979 domain-containing protein [Clostridium sp.]
MDIKQISSLLLEGFYILTGLLMLLTAFMILKDPKHPTRLGSAGFWIILAFIFIAGKYIPAQVSGLLLLLIGCLTLTKQVKIGNLSAPEDSFRKTQSKKLGNKIFIPSILLAVIALCIAQFTKLDGKTAIGISAIGALIVTLFITKSSPSNIVTDGNRMMQQIGATSILPQLLAALGTVFTTAGVGTIISNGISTIIPDGNLLAGAAAYCIGMAVFTMIMGNAFAAFAVITAGIGVPFVLAQGANPAIAGALALTAGFCGTLLTPMAANFNVLPAALLETKNKNRVIIAQVPVAIILLIIHIVLMYLWAF